MMKIYKSIACGLTALFAAISLLVSCTAPQVVEDTLTVEPSSAIQFLATGNEDVVLNVKTNVSEWKFTAPEWVIAEQSGTTLKVNVSDNADTEVQRFGKIVFTAGNAAEVSITVIQDVAEKGMAILSVTPNQPISFKDKANEPVELTIQTNQPAWECVAPEWITVDKKATTVTLTAQDNKGAERSGFVKITAGEAKSVNVAVKQDAFVAENPGSITATLQDVASTSAEVIAPISITTTFTDNVYSVQIILDQPAEKDVTATIAVAPESYLTEFNALSGRQAVMLPTAAVQMPKEMTLKVAAGQTTSNAVEFKFSVEAPLPLKYNVDYLFPIVVTENSDNAVFTPKSKRVNYIINKVNNKPVKNIVFFEVNDANPLNALEVKLEDGSLFFDAVVLFSGNIAWDAGTQSVRFNARTGEPVCNGNIAVLVNEWETYVKPLRDAGLKVYMGIMPHHTQAGIGTLSYEGCKRFGEEIGNLVKRCHFDGVCLDEEYIDYSGGQYGQMTEFWSKPRASQSYFAYQMKKQMDLAVKGEWETGVVVYQYGINCGETVKDHEDGSVHKPNEFIELNVPNYGSAAYPYPGMTKADCAGSAFELGLGSGGIRTNMVEEGFGWQMWFGYKPNPDARKGNEEWSLEKFNDLARLYYDQKVVMPTHGYKKTSKGYDPTRYEMQL